MHVQPDSQLVKATGVIMGSEKAAISSEGYIDRQTYEALSYRAQSTFVDCRPKLHSIFEFYRKMKSQLQDYDAPDRWVLSIICIVFFSVYV